MQIQAAEAQAFVELAFAQMRAHAHRLGDRVAVAPDLPGANSVFALVTHCVGMSDWWFDHAVLGNPTSRDREAEFVATGTLEDLDRLVDDFIGRLPALFGAVASTPVPVGEEAGSDRPWPWTVGSIVLHVLEELFQHAGHVDLTADLLLSPEA